MPNQALTLIRLGFLKVVFSGVGGGDPPAFIFQEELIYNQYRVQKNSSYLLNDFRNFREIFRKMCLMIILKVTKNQGFILFYENIFFEKPKGGGGGVQIEPPSPAVCLYIIYISATFMVAHLQQNSSNYFYMPKNELQIFSE